MNDKRVKIKKQIQNLFTEIETSKDKTTEQKLQVIYDAYKTDIIEYALLNDTDKRTYVSLPFDVIKSLVEQVIFESFLKSFVGTRPAGDIDALCDFIEDIDNLPSDFDVNAKFYTTESSRYHEMLKEPLEVFRVYVNIFSKLENMKKAMKITEENLDKNAWRMAYNFTNILLNEEQQQAGKEVYDEYYLLDNTGDIELQSITESHLHIVDTLASLYAWQDFKAMIGRAYKVDAIADETNEREIDTQAYNVLKSQSKRLSDYIFHVRFSDDVTKKHDENITVDAPIIRELLDKYRPIIYNTNFDGVKRLSSKDFTNIYKKNKDTLLNDPEQLQSVYSAIKDKIMVNYKQWESHYRKYDKSYKGV